MAEWIGRTVGRVRIESLIARGGMAEVYLGTHTSLGRQVAVKVMRGQFDGDSDALTRFQREAQVVAGLRHPNIIQVLDHDLVDDQPFLVMEYVSGPSLSTYLKEMHKRGEKLPLEITSRIIASLAQALDYAHLQGLVHRDIKPANVLLRSPSTTIDLSQPLPLDVEPILTDFGLVRHLESVLHTSTGTVSGTPTYMSPEQARGDKVDIRSDIYSLGVMFYEMLSGNVPFESDSTFAVLLKHINEPPPPIPSISTDLQAVIDRAMAKNPELRYARASEMSKDFHAIFNGETVSPNTVRMAKAARDTYLKQQKTQRPSLWAWIPIGVVAIAVLAATLLLRPLQSPQLPPEPTATEVVIDRSAVGQIVYSDFNNIMDRATLILNVDAPPQGMHYEMWYLSDGGEVRRNVGKVDFSGGLDHGELTFIDPEQNNIIGLYDQMEISLESDNDPSPQEPAEIVYSSIFPGRTLVHVRHVLFMFDIAPGEIALIQGLWTVADTINFTAAQLQNAFDEKNEALVRKTTEELINQIVGQQKADLYIDWDGDSVIDDPSDKFGLLDNGGIAYDTGQKISQGYIPQTISHVQFAAQAPDATLNIVSQSELVVVCLKNMDGWAKQLVEKSIQVTNTPFGPAMEPLIADIVKLAANTLSGIDSNGNQLIEAVVGECGADTAYEHAYYMGDIPIILGVNQVPDPAKTP